MCRCEKYRQYFTRDCLMGPNSFRLLDELIRRAPASPCYDRTLDLGCGMALTSVFMANETPAEQVYAFDLWVSATDNYKRIRSLDLGLTGTIRVIMKNGYETYSSRRNVAKLKELLQNVKSGKEGGMKA